MLHLSEDEVRELLPMREAIRLVEEAFGWLAARQGENQPRRRLRSPAGAVLHYMAAAGGDYLGAKLYSTHPQHDPRFLFLLFRAADGRPLAVMEAGLLGQIRTGAASGVATRHMAREDAATLGVIGSGFQARSQVSAIRAVRSLEKVKVWSRTEEKRRRFAEECAAESVATAEEAVRGSDIVVTATSSREPVLEADWVEPGTHINAIGSNQATRRELPAALVAHASRIAVDSLEQAHMESGDLLMSGEPVWPRVVELQEIVAGQAPGRGARDEITLFKSNGLAVEDVAVAAWVYAQARASGMGRMLPIFSSMAS